jgi:hypothetical protein
LCVRLIVLIFFYKIQAVKDRFFQTTLLKQK